MLSATKGYSYREKKKKKGVWGFLFPVLTARQEKSQEQIVRYGDILEN
jgi:hypothetical protein